MTRILFISHYSFLYGSNRSLESLITYFKRKGEHVEVLLPSKGLFYSYLLKNHINVHAFLFFYEAFYIKFKMKYFSLPLLWIYNLFAFPVLLYKISRLKGE